MWREKKPLLLLFPLCFSIFLAKTWWSFILKIKTKYWKILRTALPTHDSSICPEITNQKRERLILKPTKHVVQTWYILVSGMDFKHTSLAIFSTPPVYIERVCHIQAISKETQFFITNVLLYQISAQAIQSNQIYQDSTAYKSYVAP